MFLYSSQLKPWNEEDAEEGLRILKALVEMEESQVDDDSMRNTSDGASDKGLEELLFTLLSSD